MTGYGDFIFQAMFAATGATIVSGAVAERVKLELHDLRSRIRCFSLPDRRFWHWGADGLPTWISRTLPDQPLFTLLVDLALWHAFSFLGQKRQVYENGIKPIPAHSFPLAAIGYFS